MKTELTARGGPTQTAPQPTPTAEATGGPRSEELDAYKTSGSSPPTKNCTICSEDKRLDHFYKKREGHESFCKQCKKKKRVSKPKSGKAISKDIISDLSDPLQSDMRPQYTNIEPENPSPPKGDPVCFSHWESRYKRKLSDPEKLEILTNFSGFFKLLMEEEKNEQFQKTK